MTGTGDKKNMLFEIYFVDTSTKAAELDKIAPMPEITMNKKLSEVRAHLRANKVLTWKEASCTFCTLSGAELKDNLAFSDYIRLVASQGKEPGAEDNKSKSILSTVKEGDKEEKSSVKIYFRSLKRNLGLDHKTKEFLKQKMEFELKKAELLPESERKMLKGSYSHRDFMAEVGTGSKIHPVDMTEAQWNAVIETNSLLHRNTILRESYQLPITVERAMYPAFRLKPRPIFDFTEDGPKTSSKSNGNGEETPQETPEEYRIPRFIVTDDAYVEVSEHKTSVMTAMAESSLSKDSSEVAIGGGAFGWSGGVSGGHEFESSERNQKRREDETNHMIITYNFPRVTLSLDNDNLELTQECKRDLATIKTRADAGRFKRKFGCFFSTKVQLGGRLHSTQESQAVTGSTIGEKSKRLKITAAVSFSGPYAEGTVKGGYGNDSTERNESSKSSYDSHMAWEAKGGDTLLCNNPSAWCNTVAAYYNWRVVKQDNVISIEDIISKVAKDQDISDNLKRFEERPMSSSVDICFYHKESGRYLGFNSDADLVPEVMYKDLTNRGHFVKNGFGSASSKSLYAYMLGRDSRKTISLANSKEGNTQLFQLSGKMVQDSKQRFRIMKDQAYKAWNDNIKSSIGYVPLSQEYQKTQLQECWLWKKEPTVSLRFKLVNDQAAESLDQETNVLIEVYSEKGFLGHIRGAEGEDGAVVVDHGPKDPTRRDTDVASTEPLVFTLRYQPFSLNKE